MLFVDSAEGIFDQPGWFDKRRIQEVMNKDGFMIRTLLKYRSEAEHFHKDYDPSLGAEVVAVIMKNAEEDLTMILTVNALRAMADQKPDNIDWSLIRDESITKLVKKLEDLFSIMQQAVKRCEELEIQVEEMKKSDGENPVKNIFQIFAGKKIQFHSDYDGGLGAEAVEKELAAAEETLKENIVVFAFESEKKNATIDWAVAARDALKKVNHDLEESLWKKRFESTSGGQLFDIFGIYLT